MCKCGLFAVEKQEMLNVANELLFRVAFSALWIVFFANVVRAGYLAKWSGGKAAHREAGHMRITALTFAFLYLAGAMLYTLLPDWIAFLAVALPGWFRLSMVGVAALGLGFISWALWCLGKNWAPSLSGVRKDAFLVSTGPYAIIRHPIYLGAFVFLAALSLVAANLLILLPAIALLALLYTQIGGEEATLIEKFGDEYREYMKRTPRFIPTFRHEEIEKCPR